MKNSSKEVPMDKQRPRLSVEITEEQNLKLLRLIPWGVKGALFQSLVDDVIELLETHGVTVIAAILSKQLKAGDLRTFSEVLPKKKTSSERRK
jgi:hypothetical protein